MAETIIAYGEITILDLIDTATYIYYADNAEGDNPSATSEGKTHIGIYSGPALNSRPDEPDSNWGSNVWSGWQKYIGEDGSSITITSTSVMYVTTTEDVQPDDSANWQPFIPTTPQGSYLWTRTEVVYSDNSTTKAYSKTYLGKDANAYSIQTNQEEIFAFITSKGREASPEALQIKLYKLPITTNSIPIDFSENYSFGYIDGNGEYHSLITTEFSGYFSFTNNIFTYKISELSQLKNTDNSWKIPTDVVFKFAYLENKEEIAIKPIPFRLGTSEDMAKFAVTAVSINAAVGESKLEFNNDGLIIKNGCFEIRDNDNNPLLKYSPPSEGGANGSLKITGNSEFTGTIHATDGEFTGKISAIEGDIGGFIITDDGLYSKEGAKETLDGYDTSGSNIKLLGENGEIKAENITLGIGAQIDEYIQLGKEGKAFLRNPDKANHELLQAGKIKLTDTGILQLGSINLNGATSTISGSNWSITPDYAEFKNINVSGKISTAIFEQSHVQSVGGSMIFKPSYKVEDYESGQSGKGDKLTLDRAFSGEIDKGEIKNYVYLVKADGSLIEGQISIIEKNDEYKTVVISSNLNLSTKDGSNPLASLIDIGTKGSLIIGVNSNDIGTGLLRPCGFTITEYNSNNSVNSQNPKVFFGDLDKSGITFTGNQDLKGFGLYSENVYLTGSLTTQIDNNSGSTYAGINTLNGATANKFDQNIGVATDNSKIVFWAGATNLSGIANAPFQVTEAGSLYAKQGLFEEAIISKSEIKGAKIKGADIYAARIHGEGTSPNGLSFYDTNNGIVFYNGDPYVDPQAKEEEVFSIGNDGLKTKDDYFIKIQDGQNKQDRYIKFIGNEIQTSFLRLKDNQILGYHLRKDASEEVYANINFNEEGLSFGLNIQGDFVINSNEIQLKKDTVKMKKTVLFGDQLKYEQVSEGYNLYVL